ncbi:serine/threonine-protein kinase dbf2, partial [Linderina pennispora]
MADRMNQGMEYEQELPWMAHAGPDGRMHTFETFTPASMRQQQQQQQHQQQQYYYQSQQEYQQQYAQLVNPQQQQQQYLHQQQQQQQASNYPPRSPQTSHFPVPANASANSNNNMMTHQMRRMRRNNPLGSSPTMTRNELSDGSDMTVDGNDSSGTYGAGGSMTRRNAFLDTIDPAIRRKVEAAQVYFLEYYVDHLTYVANRRMRLGEFKHAIQSVRTSAQHVQDSWRDHCIRETAILRRRRNRTREREFDILAQIGQGGYGQVFLARKRDTGEVCALKKMAKKLLVKLGEVQHILTERDILRTSKSPWLVKLLYSFQDQQFLYLAMEYVPGGDVRTLLNQNGILRHHIARFYIAEMMVAVAALHSFGYFHRDLKPENYIIDASGHVKLTDFGLSHGHLSRPTLEAMKKKLDKVKDQEIIYHSSSEKRSFYKVMRQDDMPRAYSIVGSPDYMAPEILYTSLAIDQKKKQQHKPSDNSPFARLDDTTIGYDLRVDYWSLGCILY